MLRRNFLKSLPFIGALLGAKSQTKTTNKPSEELTWTALEESSKKMSESLNTLVPLEVMLHFVDSSGIEHDAPAEVFVESAEWLNGYTRVKICYRAWVAAEKNRANIGMKAGSFSLRADPSLPWIRSEFPDWRWFTLDENSDITLSDGTVFFDC